MAQQIFIQVRYSEATEVGEFNDALYYTEAHYAVLTQKDIDNEKAIRKAAWVDAVKNPPPPVAPTRAELEKLISDIDTQRAEYQAKLDEITRGR